MFPENHNCRRTGRATTPNKFNESTVDAVYLFTVGIAYSCELQEVLAVLFKSVVYYKRMI